MTQKQIAAIIRGRYTKLYEAHTPIFDRSEMYHQMYRSAMDNDGWEWDYNLVDPLIFYLVRGMLSRLNPESFRVKLEARNEGDLANREINQQIVNWELQEMNKMLLFFKFLFRGLISGRAYIKTGWLHNKALEIKDKGGQKKVMRDIVNRGYAKNLRFPDILVPNRNIPDIEEQPYIIERVMMRYGDMLDDNKNGEYWKNEYLEKIAKNKLFANTVDYGIDLPQSDDVDGNVNQDKKKENKFLRSQYVSLLCMHTIDNEVYYIPEKNEDWVLNKDMENPFWHGHYPYISWTPFPEDDEFFSMGIVQPVADLMIASTTTINQYLTNARKAGNPMWIAGTAASQTPDWMFVNRPDGIIRVVGDPNQVVPVRHQDTSETMIAMRREIMTSFERATGMSSFFMSGAAGGNTPQINKTATGARIIDSNIESNLQMLVSLLGSQAISKLGEHLLELNAQYITEEQQIKINERSGIKYVKATPEEITANFDVLATPDTMTKENPVVKQAQLLNLKSTIDAEKDVKFDKRPIWKSIFATYPEMDGVEDVIIDPEQQAKDAITDLLNGVEPPIPITMDHKAVHQLVQVFMLSNPELDPEKLQMFTKYLDNLRKYIESAKILFSLEQPLEPTNADLLAGQMGVPQPGAPTLPVEENALLKSLTSQGQAASNPTNSLPYKLPEIMQ